VAGGDSVTVDLVTDCTRAPSGEYAFQLIFYSDDPVEPELAVQYFLTVTGTGISDDETLPRELALRGNFPNPFNPATVIRYELPADARVSLRIYDVAGRLVHTLVDDVIQEGGYRSAAWDGRDGQGRRVASGVYFYKLEANGKALRKKMILVK